MKNSEPYFNVGLCIALGPVSSRREAYQAGKFGAVKCATFRRISPHLDAGGSRNNWFCKFDLCGGALLDMHMHDVDAVRYFFGRPQAVTAFGAKGMRSDGSVDHVVANYDFGDGKLISAEGGWGGAKNLPFEMSFLIICEKATLQLDNNGYKSTGRTAASKPQVSDPPCQRCIRELAYFVQMVKNGVSRINIRISGSR